MHLGWPISIQAIATACFGLIDVAIVQSLGADAVAAVGLAGRLLYVVSMVMTGLANGAAVLLSQYAGREEFVQGARLLRWVILISLAITLPACLLASWASRHIADSLVSEPAVVTAMSDFMQAVSLSIPLSAITASLTVGARSYGDSRAPLVSALVGLFCNGVLSAVLIFGSVGIPSLGVAGAGWATTMARALELGLLVALMSRSDGPTRRILRSLRDPVWRSPGLVRIAAPFMLQEALWSFSVLVYGYLFGTMGSQALALISLMAPMEGLLVILFLGAAAGSGIVIGRLLGQERFHDASSAAWETLGRTCLLSLPVCGIGSAVFAAFVSSLPWLRGQEGLVWSLFAISAGTAVMRVLAMVLVLGVLRAGGDRVGVLAVEISGTLLVGIPLVYVAVVHWGADLPHAMALLLAVESLKVLAFWLRARTGVWLCNLLPRTSDRRQVS